MAAPARWHAVKHLDPEWGTCHGEIVTWKNLLGHRAEDPHQVVDCDVPLSFWRNELRAISEA